jgi:hypothetical protein
VDQDRFSPSEDREEAAPEIPLGPGESILAEADGVVLGWQARTILIWWLPGIIFIALGWLETHSIVVTVGLAVFCVALFLFYASDREVRPRGLRRRYVLTDQRLLIAAVGQAAGWRPLDLADVASTLMEEGIADRAVRRLSGAATIVLVLRTPGPKGEPRRVRIGPMRDPEGFRGSIDLRLAPRPSPA